ncbi:Protein CBG28051 [Caenorhabditis briggsae]|uniref:Protein CBG28051 n=1 Tax=Caenorhabditis briggsae TaxID=6238 RepID=B6IGP1_CAEBR|nr:Protein CBG28051 [Caenorhabditis briggsae]CAR99071.1 Protein CBG28051 [Caenorhabditis briggsae]
MTLRYPKDNEIVVLTLAHVLEDLEKMLDYSKSIGCYLSAATIEFLHWVSDTTKMDLGSYSFSEAQTGKSASVREANCVKLK